MKKKIKADTLANELAAAIGLVWGHLSARQFEQAQQLARGCLQVWPDEKRLTMMEVYATVELSDPLDEATRTQLMNADCVEWAYLVLRRAEGLYDLQPSNDSVMETESSTLHGMQEKTGS